MEILNGKRVAITGLNASIAAGVTLALDQADAFCRRIDAAEAIPGSGRLEGFDLLVGSPVVAAAWSGADRRRVEKPILVIGTASEIREFMPKLPYRGADFSLDTAEPEEICLRAARLLFTNPADSAKTSRPPLVVAADDDLSVLALIKQLLSSDGITCHSAQDGPAALKLVRQLRPDAVLLDIQMPGMSGFEVLAAIKADPATAIARVILVTGAEQETDIMRGFSLGASDYIVKPFNPMELLVRTRRLVRRA